MSKSRLPLLGVYVDGETKTGKGAASAHIAELLEQKGYRVYYDVAGDFYRRYAALVRQDMGLSEQEVLLPGPELEQAAQRIYDNGRVPFERTDEFGDLQRPAIGESVSVLGKLPLAQRAMNEWYNVVVNRAWEKDIEVLVIDARNPRARLDELELSNIRMSTILDLYMVCSLEVAAQRTLRGNGIAEPTPEQIQKEVINVINRRELDRNRPVNPFVEPTVYETFTVNTAATDIVAKSWQPHGSAALPVSILLDNSSIDKDTMLEAVSGLVLAALEYKPAADNP